MFLKSVLCKRGPSKIFYVNRALYSHLRPGFQGRKSSENAESKNVKPLRKDLGLVDASGVALNPLASLRGWLVRVDGWPA